MVKSLTAITVAVFFFSGVLKARDTSQTRLTLKAFGVPDNTLSLASLALPAAEIGIATALSIPSKRRPGAMAGIGLLCVFNIAIATNLALGRKLDCGCFGRRIHQEIGWPMVGRNIILIFACELISRAVRKEV